MIHTITFHSLAKAGTFIVPQLAGEDDDTYRTRIYNEINLLQITLTVFDVIKLYEGSIFSDSPMLEVDHFTGTHDL